MSAGTEDKGNNVRAAQRIVSGEEGRNFSSVRGVEFREDAVRMGSVDLSLNKIDEAR